MGVSLVQRLVQQYGAEQFYQMLTPHQRETLRYEWEAVARPEQLPPPGAWRWWLCKPGRGWGKTRAGAEWVRQRAKAMPGSRGFLIGKTGDDARAVMVEGESGLLACSPRSERPEWYPSLNGGLLVWPQYGGTQAQVFSAHNYEDLRGPQHHWGWADELASWTYAQEAFDQLSFGLRLEYQGQQPQAIITTTPRPISVVRKLMKDPRTHVTDGSTYENRDNLAADFLREMLGRYEGTRLGRQELHGEVLDDVPGALWSRSMFEWPGFRAPGNDRAAVLEGLDYVVVAIDPAASNTSDSDHHGIVVAGRRGMGDKAKFDVLADYSMKGTPREWAMRAVEAFHHWHADRIVAEVNNGGDMVVDVIRAVWDRAPVKKVHASRGKHIRAEPVAALYEQHRVRHAGAFDQLEDQMCLFVPGEGNSPDRMDALVWAITELTEGKRLVLT